MKRSKLKQILALILTLTLMLTAVPLTALPALAATSGNFEYEVLSEADKACQITAYNGSAAKLEIPAKIYSYSVTGIGDRAFAGCKSLTSVTIPDSIVSIGFEAFSGCLALTAINVSKNNKNFSSIDGAVLSKDGKKLILCPEGKKGSYAIPDGVTSIGEGAADYCAISSVAIPDSVKIIEDWAFEFDYYLTSITIGNGVTNIGKYAFYGCALKSVTIPQNVKSIGYMAFGYVLNELTDENEKISNFTIYGYKGTEAERYANNNGFTFIALQGGDTALLGDVNGDGKVSAVDARWALQCAAKKRTLDEKQTKAADMNGDGKITAVDARQILKKAAGK